MKNTINNGASPLLKRLLNEPNIYINLLSSGALWHVDFVNGVAKRINISDRVHDEYPFYYSDCKSIETYIFYFHLCKVASILK